VLLTLAAFVLFIPMELGVNVPLFTFLFYVVVFAYQGRTKSDSDRGSIYLMLIAMIAVLPFILYDTSPFRILQFILLIGFVLHQVFTMYGCRHFKGILQENWGYDALNATVFMPIANFDTLWRTVFALPQKKRLQILTLLLSVGLIAAPVLAILLSGVYRSFAASVGAYFGGAAMFFLIVSYLYGFLFGCRHARRTYIFRKPERSALARAPKWLVITLLLMLCFGCAAYVVAQIVFFAPAFSGQITDAQLAEYARQGFMELCGVVLLNLAVIAIAAVCTRVTPPPTVPGEKAKSASPMILGLIVVLCALSILLIAAAFVKMLLYMDAYGLTTNRIITSWFMLGLALVCGIIIARAFSSRIRPIRAITLAAIAMFLMLCYADCDYLAVSYNLSAYKAEELPGFDIEMLYDCGDSIVPVMIEVYENSDGQLQKDAQKYLDYYHASHDDSFRRARSFNISSYTAHNKYLEWIEE